MNKYGLSAVRAVEYINSGLAAEAAWEKATCEIFGEGTSSQKKGCPRGAFLGLFSEEKSKKSKKNAMYAIEAIEFLKKNPKQNYSAIELWRQIVDEPKVHNSQMDVVLALWRKNLI